MNTVDAKILLDMAENRTADRVVYKYGDDVFRLRFENNNLYISCDGTSSVLDAVRNLLFMRNNRSDCAKAWYDPARGFWSWLKLNIPENYIKSMNIRLGGKSRGGSDIQDVARRFMKSGCTVKCFSFGAPAVGGSEWVGEMKHLLKETKSELYRFEAKGDKVPNLPFSFMGFKKAGNIIHVPKYKGFINTHLYAYKRFIDSLKNETSGN